MYPMVKGKTDSVHGERLLARPAPRTRTYVTGEKPLRLAVTALSRDCWNSKKDKSADPKTSVGRACVASSTERI